MNYEKIDEVYEKLNQLKNRATYDILRAVCRNPGRPIKYVARTARADVNSTSKHIKFLASIGLVRAVELGRECICYPKHEEIQKVISITSKLAEFYNPHIVVPDEKEMCEV